MSYHLFLDDVRQPVAVLTHMKGKCDDFLIYTRNDWVIVRDFKEFKQHILSWGLPEMVSFDHDLAAIHYDPKTWTEGFEYKEETGYDCAAFLVEFCMDNGLKFPPYAVHSFNPIGAERIKALIENFKKYQNELSP